MALIGNGAELHGERLLQEIIYPEERRWRDVSFAVVFVVVYAFFLTNTVFFISEYSAEAHPQMDINWSKVKTGLAMAGCAALGSFFTSIAYSFSLRRCPVPIVWGCLLLSPVSTACLALAVLAANPVAGLVLLLLAGIQLMVVFCWSRFIPFTAALLSVASEVALKNLRSLWVGVFGFFLQLTWLAVIGVGSARFVSQLSEQNQEDYQGALFVGIMLPLLWGMMAYAYAMYVSYCGMYGRWCFGHYPSVTASLTVAFTKSFGSVCFGALLVAVVRLLRIMVDSARRQGRDRNGAQAVIACLVSCVLRLIEDIMEWFNTFAYVQVAVRGLTYTDSCRATAALARTNNFGAVRSQLVSTSVVGYGVLLSAVVGVIAAFAACPVDFTGKHYHPSPDTQNTVAVWITCSIIMAFSVAGLFASLLDAGVTTIIVCWGESPTVIAAEHPGVHEEFVRVTGRSTPIIRGGHAYA
jgi:hypothetical protein